MGELARRIRAYISAKTDASMRVGERLTVRHVRLMAGKRRSQEHAVEHSLDNSVSHNLRMRDRTNACRAGAADGR